MNKTKKDMDFLEFFYFSLRWLGKYIIGIPIMIVICFLAVYIDIIYDAGTLIAKGIVAIANDSPKEKE